MFDINFDFGLKIVNYLTSESTNNKKMELTSCPQTFSSNQK